MFLNPVLFGILKSIQDYLQDETDFPLVLLDYHLGSTVFKKCFFFSEELQPNPDLLKRISTLSQREFFLLLYRRNSIQIENYRKFDIRAYSKDYIQSLVSSGLFPEDYKGNVRLAKVSIQVKPYSNVSSYVYEFEELFFMDWVGQGSIEVSVPLREDVEFTFNLGYNCEPWQEVSKENPTKRLFTGTFEIELEFPLVKLDKTKSKLIKDIVHILYT
jgi:hypothetical protein